MANKLDSLLALPTFFFPVSAIPRGIKVPFVIDSDGSGSSDDGHTDHYIGTIHHTVH
jgi:hypothetical protein